MKWTHCTASDRETRRSFDDVFFYVNEIISFREGYGASCRTCDPGCAGVGEGSQQQGAGEDLERGLPAQARHVGLREAVGRVAGAELRERAREHAAVAAVHLLRDVLQHNDVLYHYNTFQSAMTSRDIDGSHNSSLAASWPKG